VGEARYRMQVNDEVWLPKHVAVAVDGRIALLKKLNLDIDVTFRDYRKFVAETTIRPIGEIQPQQQ
jgi:hypothetical protein